MRIVLEDPSGTPEPDYRLIRLVLRAISWFDLLSTGKVASIRDLAKAERCHVTLISDRIRLAFLAPDIVEAILKGTQPPKLNGALLLRSCPLPVAWEEQRKLLMH